MQLARALTMRVYEASISYNLVELGENLTVNTAAKAVEYLQSAFAVHPMQETFWVILLDRKNHALGRVMITLGTVANTLVHPREVFKPAFLASASAVIVAHNHPSGVMPHPVLCRMPEAHSSEMIHLDAA